VVVTEYFENTRDWKEAELQPHSGIQLPKSFSFRALSVLHLLISASGPGPCSVLAMFITQLLDAYRAPDCGLQPVRGSVQANTF